MLIKGKLQYGCFRAAYKCEKCNKIVCVIDISYDGTHIGYGDDDKIKSKLYETMKLSDNNYCTKCGSEIKYE